MMKLKTVSFVFVWMCLYGLDFPAINGKKACLHGLNYTPTIGPDYLPDAQRCKNYEGIKHDFQVLKTITRRIRLYSITGCNQAEFALKAAKEVGMQVWLGVWVGKYQATFDGQFTVLKALIERKLVDPKIVLGIHVGSEAIYRNETTVDDILANTKKVKTLFSAVTELKDIPVTVTDIADTYIRHPELHKPLDMVSANIFPFWEHQPVEKAVEQMLWRLKPVVEQAKDTPQGFILSETGWPSNGENNISSKGSPESQARYLRDFWCKVHVQHNLDYYYFSAIDLDFHQENVEEDMEVEGYFGLFDSSLKLKNHIQKLKMKCEASPDIWQFTTTEDCPDEVEGELNTDGTDKKKNVTKDKETDEFSIAPEKESTGIKDYTVFNDDGTEGDYLRDGITKEDPTSGFQKNTYTTLLLVLSIVCVIQWV